jgi:alpha-glucosidase (family GH31 glycosyl hydrolase)
VEGLDPLWIFNHYHFLDNGRDGKRPMTFSRYAGPGSHRYPVGFSGDTIVTWESLRFQPYFTANASNIGYGWGSHDIGGHMHGYRNDELVTRWVQLGVYSPINRLHASNSPFQGKEPWRYKGEARQAMSEALRERHRLVPYLYTMNHRAWKEGRPLVEPLYYRWSEAPEAYEHPDQYFFGTQLMAAPVTSPRIDGLNVAKVPVWLPEGTWYDLYTGMVYTGGRTLDLYRSLDSIPVLAPAGAILSLTDEITGAQAASNPASLRIKVFAGADGDFTLYEDDNTTQKYLDGVCVTTPMTYREVDGRAVFTVHPAQGELSLVPAKRTFTVELMGFADAAGAVEAKVGGAAVPAKTSYDSFRRVLSVTVEEVPAQAGLEISLGLEHRQEGNDTLERCFRFLDQAELSFDLKDEIYRCITGEPRIPVLLGQLSAMELDRDLYGVLLEILTAW